MIKIDYTKMIYEITEILYDHKDEFYIKDLYTKLCTIMEKLYLLYENNSNNNFISEKKAEYCCQFIEILYEDKELIPSGLYLLLIDSIYEFHKIDKEKFIDRNNTITVDYIDDEIFIQTWNN